MAGKYLATLAHPSQLPKLVKGDYLHGRPEPRVALVGRSNVGKSSLLNALLGGSLAQTSKRPGKTQAIYFYVWEDTRLVLADLPGYGFAKAHREKTEQWSRFIEAYFKSDPGLRGVLFLVDGRHGPTDLDLEALDFLSFHQVPVILILTKFDTLKTQKDKAQRKREIEDWIKKEGRSFEGVYWVSVRTKDGLKELIRGLKRE